MKKALPLIFMLPILLCFSKGVAVLKSSNEISANIDGINTTFNNITAARHTSESGTFTLAITALVNSYSTDAISISLKGIFSVHEGTFIKGLASSGSHTPDISYTHRGDTYETDQYPLSPITITISSITGNNVQGSFSGRLYLHAPGQAGSVEITNGKFNVDFK